MGNTFKISFDSERFKEFFLITERLIESYFLSLKIVVKELKSLISISFTAIILSPFFKPDLSAGLLFTTSPTIKSNFGVRGNNSPDSNILDPIFSGIIRVSSEPFFLFTVTFLISLKNKFLFISKTLSRILPSTEIILSLS